MVCFSGTNLDKVAYDLRNQFPDAVFQIAADLDAHGKGLKYANAAAAACAPAVVVLPDFIDNREAGDFNDLHQAEGLNAVRQQITVDIATMTQAVVPFRTPALPICDARDGTGDSRPLTEYGNAQRLFDLHGANVRYVHDSASWLTWNAGAWHWDRDGSTLRTFAADLSKFMALSLLAVE